MDEYRQKQLRAQELERQAEEQKQLGILQDDRAALEQARQGGAFRYSPKKSLARNYRDYALARAAGEGADPVGGVYAKAADHIAARTAMFSGRELTLPQGPAPLPAGETALDAGVCLKNLCRCTLLQKELGSDELISLTEHLTAGALLLDRSTDPDAALHGAMHERGLAALGEIYARQLDALADKYGDRLAKLSACDYLRRLPEIENDFACLDDMRKFLTLYQPAQSAEDVRLRARLAFFSDAFAILRARGEALASMTGAAVTEKGGLEKGAERDYAGRLAALRSAAAAGDVFERRAEKRALAPLFVEAEERKARAANALLNSREERARAEQEAEEQQRSTDELQKRLVEYEAAKQTWSVLQLGEIKGRDRMLAQAAWDRYQRSPGHLSDEDAAALMQRLNGIKQANYSTIRGTKEPTPENIVALLSEQRENTRTLAAFLSGADDEQLLRERHRFSELARQVEGQMRQIEGSFLAEWRASVEAWDTGGRTISKEEYTRRKPATEAYTALRDYYNPLAKTILNADRIMLTRLESIRACGCTQAYSLTETVSPLAERGRLLETEKGAGQKEMTLERARHLEPGLGAFTKRDTEMNTVSLAEMKETLAAMRTVDALRRDQPDFYRLGQSYKDFQTCERLCALLPVYEKAYLLLLRTNLLADRGGETQQALERQFDEAASAYTSSYVGLQRDCALAPSQIAAKLRGEFEQNLQAEDKKAAALRGDASLADEGVDRALVENAVASRATVFIDTTQRETAVRDLVLLRPLLTYSMEKDAVDEPVERAALTLVSRFDRSWRESMAALGGGAACTDSALLEHRAQLEKTALMARSIRDLVSENKLLGPLADALAVTPFADLSARELAELPARAAQIEKLSDYANGLAFRQAAKNGVPELSYISGGRGIVVKGREQLEKAGDILAQSGLAAVLQLRADSGAQARAEELKTLDTMTRVREGVGRELEASARSGGWTKVRSLTEWCGNALGRPLQFLSWLLHERRSADHGEVRYERSKTLYAERMAQRPGTADSTLPDWQRGDANYAPPVRLDKYYGSPLKKGLRGLLDAAPGVPDPATDALADEYGRALEAARLYCGVVGVVNSDTAEMEMAFLDTFKKRAQHYREYHESAPDEAAAARLALLSRIEASLDGALTGTLGKSLGREALARIDEATTAYVEDTCYLPNMQESNIRDIPLFLHEPNVNDIRQSSVGDCWLVSALTTVTKTSPEFIRGMFQDLGDGNVLVRLYAADDAQGRPLGYKGDLTKPGVSFRPAYFKLRKQYETGWGNAADCTWVQLLEKAYALSGFNTRKAVEVRDGRLYNVADELTMGQISFALAHLTGRLPESLYYSGGGVPENSFLSREMRSGLFAGVDSGTAAFASKALESFQSSVPSSGETEKRLNCIDTVFEILDSHRPELALRMLGKTEGTLTPRQEESAYARLREQIRANFEKMVRGEALDFGGEEKNAAQHRETANGLTPLLVRRHTCTYFSKPREAGGYEPKAINFYQQCRAVFDRGGSVSIAIGHCVDLIDAQEHNGRLFLLLRDPFNAYNTVYTSQNGAVREERQGFGTMLLMREENRRIPAAADSYLTAGFRGTSWVELGSLLPRLTDAKALLPDRLPPA